MGFDSLSLLTIEVAVGEVQLSFWILFHVFVLAMLALDLGVFHRQS
ncbi:MAG: hypothetical protein RI932_938, partial [Pseudomonadota bacterium]